MVNLEEYQTSGLWQRSGRPDRTWKTRKQGRRGGLCLRIKRQPLSRISISLLNVQSLRNKTDELQSQAHYSHEFREACILALTETWLSETRIKTWKDLVSGCPFAWTGIKQLQASPQVWEYVFTLMNIGVNLSSSEKSSVLLILKCFLFLYALVICPESFLTCLSHLCTSI